MVAAVSRNRIQPPVVVVVTIIQFSFVANLTFESREFKKLSGMGFTR
jgi:hypothetical protein